MENYIMKFSWSLNATLAVFFKQIKFSCLKSHLFLLRPQPHVYRRQKLTNQQTLRTIEVHWMSIDPVNYIRCYLRPLFETLASNWMRPAEPKVVSDAIPMMSPRFQLPLWGTTPVLWVVGVSYYCNWVVYHKCLNYLNLCSRSGLIGQEEDCFVTLDTFKIKRRTPVDLS